MSYKKRLILTALAALLIVSGAMAPIALAEGENNASKGKSANDYTLAELQKGGEVVDQRFPSLRVAGEMTGFWLVRYEPNGLGSYGEDSTKEYISPDSTVKRNQVRLYGTFPFDGENRTYTLTKVYWTPETRTVETKNGTTTERFANVTAVDTQKVEFQSGMRQKQEVTLRGHYDRATRVTMFLDLPNGERLRWSFGQKSVATAAPVDISSRGDLYEWAFLWIVLPSLVVAYAVGKKVPKIRKKALAGPGRGAGTWIILGIVVMSAAYLFAYLALASLVAALPLVFPLLVGWILSAILIEDSDGESERWGFVRLDPETAASPLEEKAELLDSGNIDIKGFDVVFTPDNEPALYEKGLLSMWARYKGKYATLNIENQDAIWHGHGDYDKVIIVDSDEPQLVSHLPARVIFAWPWRTYEVPRDEFGDLLDDEHDAALFRALPQELDRSAYVATLGLLATPIAAAFLANQYLGSWLWGPLACIPLVLRYATPIEGEARTKVAPGQARKAWTTAWYLDLNVRRFGTITEVAEALIESENKKFNAAEWLDSAREQGLISEAHNRQGKPFESVLTSNDPALDKKEDDSEDRPRRRDRAKPMRGDD